MLVLLTYWEILELDSRFWSPLALAKQSYDFERNHRLGQPGIFERSLIESEAEGVRKKWFQIVILSAIEMFTILSYS